MSNDETSTADQEAFYKDLMQGIKKVGMPVDLSINRFKQYMSNDYPDLPKSQRNYAIKKYKAEAWADYDEMVKFKLTEPTRTKSKDNDGKQS